MRKPKKSTQRIRVDCELCGAAEPEPGDHHCCEGFIVCTVCRDERGPELSALRADVEREMAS